MLFKAMNNPEFQSTPLSRGETMFSNELSKRYTFQSTPLSRGETIVPPLPLFCVLFQSTPLSRGETLSLDKRFICRIISIHSPLTRGDCWLSSVLAEIRQNFNPLPSHEGRQAGMPTLRTFEYISIHSPLTRGDSTEEQELYNGELFQSTPLSRGETLHNLAVPLQLEYFNPLPSHEGRRYPHSIPPCFLIFQSTPLSRGETHLYIHYLLPIHISIHSPLTRGDLLL